MNANAEEHGVMFIMVLSTRVYVLFKFAKNSYGGTEVDTTSSSGDFAGLSPFLLSAERYGSRNLENLWQYSKVYLEQVTVSSMEPDEEWWKWRENGFNNPRAVRYPMGKGRIPLYSYWQNSKGDWEKLGYIAARKKIYLPIYAELVQQTDSFRRLAQLFSEGDVVLRDYDGYDYVKMGRSLVDVVNDPNRKCGHAFVLAMMLTDQLEECIQSKGEFEVQKVLV